MYFAVEDLTQAYHILPRHTLMEVVERRVERIIANMINHTLQPIFYNNKKQLIKRYIVLWKRNKAREAAEYSQYNSYMDTMME